MGEYVAYRVDLGFPSQLPLETCKIDGDQKLTFNMWEDGSNPDTSERKDTLLNKTQPETLPVGGSATSIFEQMHSWDWTGQAENNCLESLASSTMLNAYLEAFKNIERLKAIANFVDSGLKVQEFYKIVTDPFGLILLTKYDVIYVVSAHDSFLSSRAEVPAALTVLVPDDQRTAWMNYQLEVLMAAMYGSVVSTVFSPIAGIGFVSGVMLNACVDFDYAVRYKVDSIAASSGAQDDGYKQVVEIIPISSPTINAQSDSTEKTIALAWLKATEYATAEKTSLERYEQAKLAVDQEWILKHLNAAIMFNEQYVQILEEISELTDGYIQELESEGFVLTEADLDAWQAKLRNEGLPEEQRTILQELGFDDADIDAYEGVAGEYVDVVPLEWQELTSMLLELSSDNAQTQGELLSGELCVLYDLNDDDYIDLEDINQVLFNSIFYGMPYDAQYDFVADGVIDIADVFDVVLEFGNACS